MESKKEQGFLQKLFSPNNMSEGTPWKRLAMFAIPQILGNFAQQLYNTVDTIVVGNSRWGYTALAAVGSSFPVLMVLMALFVGVATGTGIMVAQFFGARNKEGLGKTIANCTIMTIAVSLFIMIVGPFIVDPMLKAINTLPELYDYCKTYLLISFLGIGGNFAYNIYGGMLRGMGDSFSALGFLLITTVLNIIGDLLLVERFGVAGVAFATIFAQAVSAVLCIRKVLSLKQYFTLTKKEWKPDGAYIKRIIGLGIPSGITMGLSSISNLLVTRLINSFGDSMFIAANSLTMRVDGYAMMPTMSMGMAMSTFAGQNIGAGRMDRVKIGLRQCIFMSLGITAVMGPLVLMFGPNLLRLFTPEQALNDMTMGLIYIIAPTYVINCISQPMMGVIRGAGDTISPMWMGIGTNIVLRLITAYGFVALAKNAGATLWTQERMVFLSMVFGMVVNAIITFFLYKYGRWKNLRIMNFAGGPGRPGGPGGPGGPKFPGAPGGGPGGPKFPGAPEGGEGPKFPGAPEGGEAPKFPGAPEAGEIPEASSVPESQEHE